MSARTPADTATVIVIDLQTGMFSGAVLPPICGADALVERVRIVIDWARRSGRKVAFIRHDAATGEPLAPGEPGWPIWPALGRVEDEPVFAKSVGDAFSRPALGDWLSKQGSSEVILMGAQTDKCVAATVDGALRQGLLVTVVGDAHSTWDSDGESAEQIIARHNTKFATAGARVVSTEEFQHSPQR
jgi:nicotinamidase-related amidase